MPKHTFAQAFAQLPILDIYAEWRSDTRFLSKTDIQKKVKAETNIKISKDTIKLYAKKMHKYFPSIQISHWGSTGYHISMVDIIIALVNFLRKKPE